MYTRDFSPPSPSPVVKGKAVHGTWNRAFDDVNLASLAKPLALPFPRFRSTYRLKEWQTFLLSNNSWVLSGAIMDLKYFRVARITLWDIEKREVLNYRKTLPMGSWRLPRSLSNSSVTSSSLGFYVRIHNWLDAELIEIDMDIDHRAKRNSFTGHVEFDLHEARTRPYTSCLPLAGDGCMYSSKIFTPVHGDFVFGGRHISMTPADSGGIFCDYKGFFPYRYRGTWAQGQGRTAEGLAWAFSIADNHIDPSSEHHEHVLWLDGSCHPLPAVRITRAGESVDSDWVIQDTEGMVDLTFTPRAPNSYTKNKILTRTDYQAPLGVYNGQLVSPHGDRIPVRNLEGIIENLYLRL